MFFESICVCGISSTRNIKVGSCLSFLQMQQLNILSIASLEQMPLTMTDACACLTPCTFPDVFLPVVHVLSWMFLLSLDTYFCSTFFALMYKYCCQCTSLIANILFACIRASVLRDSSAF